MLLSSALVGSLFALVVVMSLFLLRALKGPSVFDRAVAMNALGTKTVLVVLLLGFYTRRIDVFIDIALVYALVNFVTTVAILRLVQEERLG